MVDQTQFVDALLNPDSDVPEGIIRPDGSAAGKRFDVYRNNVVTSLIEALGTAFPIIKQLVGEQFFNAVAGVFVRQNPPSSPLLMLYGARFAEFLEKFEPTQKLAYLPDMARLEHGRRLAYHAADATPLPADALAQIAPEKLGDLTFSLHASTQIVASTHPIFSIWRFNSTDDKSPIDARGEDVLIARPEQEVEMRILPPGAAHFITALQHNASLADAAEAATEAQPSFDLSDSIGALLAARILIDIQNQ